MNPEDKSKEKWYFRDSTLIIGIIVVGLAMLPLVWVNPRFSGRKKVIVSILIVVVSIILAVVTINAVKLLGNYYQEITRLNF